VPRDRIKGAGVPHFDAHRNLVSQATKNRVLTGLGLSSAKPYLLFGMSSPVLSPFEIEIVEWLADRIENGGFGPDLQLVIRPHPQNIESGMADPSWLSRLCTLRSARVAINYPRLGGGSLPWDLQEDDLGSLANLVAGCSVCLNSGSTLSIDAIVQDRPVMLTMFDGSRCPPIWNSARRLLDYIHQRKLVSLGGVRVARSFDELEEGIHLYLADPELDAAGRELTRQRELGGCDGRASARVAEALVGFAEQLPRAEEIRQ